LGLIESGLKPKPIGKCSTSINNLPPKPSAMMMVQAMLSG